MASSSSQIEYGIIKSWFADKGFGFATIDYLGDIFIHVSDARSTPTEQSFGSGGIDRVPKIGDRIQAISVLGDRGMRARVWGFSTRKVVVPLRVPRKRPGPSHDFAKARKENLERAAVRIVAELLLEAPPERRHTWRVINFFEGQAMRDRVRHELEKRLHRDFAEPSFEACRCMIVPERIEQMEEGEDERIKHAPIESTFFVYRIVRHDCPLHINATPIRYVSFRDCGEYPLDNERATFVGECDDWRSNWWHTLVEDPWYRIVVAHGYCDPRDYLDD